MKVNFININSITHLFFGVTFALLLGNKLSYADVLNTQTPILPTEMVEIMGSGVDVTWSEVPSKIDEYTAKATIDFAEKGFKHFRLRVANDDVTAITSFLDQQIQDALDNGVIPIIANQSHSFEDNPTVETQAAWVKWWGDIAEHYKDYPYDVMFDLIIEIASRSSLSDEPIDQLNEAYEQAVTAIRATGGNNTNRIIIFSAHKRSDATRMHLLDIPTQGNGYLMGEFHEGYASGPSTDPTNPHYYWEGSAAEIKLMSDRADAAVAWSEKTGIPIWEGAWMPGNYNKGDDYDIARQINFVNDFVKVLNDRNIPHAVNATKKFYDVVTNEWNELEEVVDAIIALRVDNQVLENQVPVWTSTTFILPSIDQDENFSYDISAEITDAENDLLTFAKVSGSQWLNVSAEGLLSGIPSALNIGENDFVISASDGDDLSREVNAHFIINVSEVLIIPEPPEELVNTAPTFVSDIIKKAAIIEGNNITQSLSDDASDIENSTLMFTKLAGPQWLLIAEDGTFSGTPNSVDIGLNSFSIAVSDEEGLTDTAILEIEVKAKEVLPEDSNDTAIPNNEESSSAGGLSIILLCLLLSSFLRKTVFLKYSKFRNY